MSSGRATSARCRSNSSRPIRVNPRRSFADAELRELSDSIKQPRRDPADRGATGKGRAGSLRDHRWRTALACVAARRAARSGRSFRSRLATAMRSRSRSSRTSSARTSTRWKRRRVITRWPNEFKRSQDDIAKIVGKSRSHVANMMRLTRLPAKCRPIFRAANCPAGHARALIGVPDPLAAAKRIVAEGLTVRQAEALAHDEGVPVRKPQKARGGKGKEFRHTRAGEARSAMRSVLP